MLRPRRRLSRVCNIRQLHYRNWPRALLGCEELLFENLRLNRLRLTGDGIAVLRFQGLSRKSSAWVSDSCATPENANKNQVMYTVDTVETVISQKPDVFRSFDDLRSLFAPANAVCVRPQFVFRIASGDAFDRARLVLLTATLAGVDTRSSASRRSPSSRDRSRR